MRKIIPLSHRQPLVTFRVKMQFSPKKKKNPKSGPLTILWVFKFLKGIPTDDKILRHSVFGIVFFRRSFSNMVKRSGYIHK